MEKEKQSNVADFIMNKPFQASRWNFPQADAVVKSQQQCWKLKESVEFDP